MNFLRALIAPSSQKISNVSVCLIRVGIGILTIGHGIPKIMGGFETWNYLGTFVHPLGIYFLPVMWGFFGACTEFFGGIALTLGFMTRLASLALALMMFVATIWHIYKGDGFQQYSFPLSLLVIFVAFMIMGGGAYSLDARIANRKS